MPIWQKASRTDASYFIMGEVYVSLVFTVGYEAMEINKLRMLRVVNKISTEKDECVP